MGNYYQQLLTKFCVIGISYHTLPTVDRGQFAVSNEQYLNYLQIAKQIPETFLLSTCNRTEIYCFGAKPENAVNAFCEALQIDKDFMLQHSYTLVGEKAIQHLFRVVTGLDSQILGDYEIVGQIKRAYNFALEHNSIGQYLDRSFKQALQAARAVRAQTQISSGSVSVAFAAAQFVQKNLNRPQPTILFIGVGEIGRNTAINLCKLLPTANYTFSNRTIEKAALIATELSGEYLSLEDSIQKASTFDCVITAATTNNFLLEKAHLNASQNYVLVDLSIPNNINPDVQLLKGVVYANVDHISKINDTTLQQRVLEIPKVESIINTHFLELTEWLKHRKMVPMIKEVKEKLLCLDEHFSTQEELHPKEIQKVINNMATKLKDDELSKPGCNYIETYVEYIEKIGLKGRIH